jgi:AraC-like DNA-binding protein
MAAARERCRASRDTTCRDAPSRLPSGGLAAWWPKRVKLYIDAHLAEWVKCRELADLVKLSAGHFNRGFVASFGRSPHDYILRRRMEHAKLLMRTTSRLLEQIAMECGMADQAHFCRTFLRIVGDRPRSGDATTPGLPTAGSRVPFLPERERRRIPPMGAPDLDDAVPCRRHRRDHAVHRCGRLNAATGHIRPCSDGNDKRKAIGLDARGCGAPVRTAQDTVPLGFGPRARNWGSDPSA